MTTFIKSSWPIRPSAINLLPDGTEPPPPTLKPVETITNTVSGVSITGTDDADLIDNSGSLVTLLGGDDTLNNTGSNVLFKCRAGDGNDSIVGFNSSSTLRIGNGKGSYSTQVSGLDVIISVGDNKITLRGAALSLETLNIDGQEYSKTIWTLTNSSAAKVTVSTIYGVAEASARTKAIRIAGNAPDNSIGGGAGKDSLE